MAVFRIEKTKDYTVMSNHHLRNRELSLKGKGLLSLMLSLPENWDYTLKGLSAICKDGIDSVRKGVTELEETGYLIRRRIRGANGQLGDVEYTILEMPRETANDNDTDSANIVDNPPISDVPMFDKPMSEKPISGNPILVKPMYDNPAQSITKQSSIKELNPHELNIHQSIKHPANKGGRSPFSRSENADRAEQPETASYPQSKEIDRIDRIDRIDEMDSIDVYREIITENIEYENLCENYKYSVDVINEIVALMLEAVCTTRKTIRIGGDDKPSAVVKSQLLKLDYSHIEYVLECLDKNTTDIRNIKSYLLTTIFNAPATIGSYYKARVNHDLYGGK